MELVLIAAVAANGVIGRDGSLPWHLPEDLAHFKETTMGHPVIMGRVAFADILEHLGRPLPGRTNIVMSRSSPSLPDEVIVVTSREEAIDAAKDTSADRAYVAGGETVYREFMEQADRMILSELHESYDGDVFFPPWNAETWQEVDRSERAAFDIVEYVRRN